MHHHKSTITHSLSLIGILAAAVLGFTYFAYDRSFQVAIAVAVCFAYFTWGVIHHLLHKDLYLIVALEYLLVSFMGLLILLSLIYRT
jgi:hypothetical protein